jgi:uncharacterized protein (TIGR02444 family)
METDDADRFWDFSVWIYAEPLVKASALRLQDEAGLDVNIALYAVFAAVCKGERLDKAAFEAMIKAVEPVNEAMVRPFRAARRKARGRDKARLLDAELAAERLAQQLIVEAQPSGEPAADAITLNLTAYGGAVTADLDAACRSRLAQGFPPALDGA